METTLDKTSDIDLIQELKSLSRKVRGLKASIPSDLSTPKQVVDKARIEDEIAEVAKKQNEIGLILLARDREREKRKTEQLSNSAAEGAEKAALLLEGLSKLGEKVSVAFKVLGEEYGELLQLSREIRSINSVLLSAGRPHCIPASLKIEPNGLNRLIKSQFRESFGANAADVSLQRKFDTFDIIDAIEDIQKSVKS